MGGETNGGMQSINTLCTLKTSHFRLVQFRRDVQPTASTRQGRGSDKVVFLFRRQGGGVCRDGWETVGEDCRMGRA